MRKEIVEHRTTAGRSQDSAEWLDLDSIARVQLTSEDPASPIENALGTSPERNERGWRASGPGPQTITLSFDAHNISGGYFCILSNARRNAYRSLCSVTAPRVRQTAKSYASSGPSAQPAPRRRSKIMRLNWNL
jgi:hypothetical protein